MLRSAALVSVTAGLLAGCGGTVEIISRSAHLPGAILSGSKSPERREQREFAQPIPAAEFLLTALARSPEVTAAEAELADFQHRRVAVNWQIAPTPYIGATASNSDGAGARIGLRQPIWAGGRWGAEKALSDAEVKKARAQLELARHQVAIDITEAFSDWARAHHEVNALETSLSIHRELGAQIDRRFNLGLASASEQILLNNRLDRTLLDLEVANNQSALARQRLRALAGEDGDMSFAALFNQKFGASDAVVPSPTVALARANHEIAIATTRMARAKTRPSIYLETGYDVTGSSGSFAQLGFDTAFLAGLGGSKRLYGHAAAEEAAARRVELALRTAQAVQTEAQLSLDSARAQRQLHQRMVAAQQELFESYRRQFKLGDRRWLDVLNAAQELSGARTALAHAQAEVTRANWILAIQQGLTRHAASDLAEPMLSPVFGDNT